MNVQLPPILDFNSNTNKGTLFDTRDGQSYPVIRINNQIWLAENFRYLPSIEKGDLFDTSCVYDNDNSYLEKGYGRLYDYDTANNIAPEGWRLPSNKDFQELKDFIIKDNNLNDSLVGSYLKSINDWNKPTNIGPNNAKYGFNAKPAGYHSNDYFNDVNDCTFFWSVVEYNSGFNSGWYLDYGNGTFSCDISNIRDNDKFSVRLIKDS
jgi:uncharacterized protein (TIGR02145 family)